MTPALTFRDAGAAAVDRHDRDVRLRLAGAFSAVQAPAALGSLIV